MGVLAARNMRRHLPQAETMFIKRREIPNILMILEQMKHILNSLWSTMHEYPASNLKLHITEGDIVCVLYTELFDATETGK